MKSYVFKVVIEEDEDVYHAYCPALKNKAAYTWGRTKEEALRHIQEVVQMVVEEMIEEGESISSIERCPSPLHVRYSDWQMSF